MNKNLDKYGGYREIKGTATGFFHFEKINGRYWFITPEGNAFFAVALSHMFAGEARPACDNLYAGDSDAWMKDTFAKGKAMGFNCALGSATSPERNLDGFVDMDKAEALFRESNFPFAVGVILLKHPWEFVDGETLPDIYDPDYKKLIESRAESVCPIYKDDPLIMGYYYGFGAFNKADEWVNHHMSMKPGSPGRNRISDLLAERYDNDAAAFNEVYGLDLEAISDLKKKGKLVYENALEFRNYPSVRKDIDPKKVADFEAIISDMCVRLYKIAHDAIRKWDNNHLIFGSFLKEWVLSEASWKEVAPYVDLIAPQHVNKEIFLNDLADGVNMPMIVSDEDAGWTYEGGIPGYKGLKSHDARGEAYRANLMRQYKDPQVMGISYCAGIFDQGGNIPLKKELQNGFYDYRTGEARDKLIEITTEINESVYKEASNPAATQEEVKKYEDRFFTIFDENEA